jgi:hypothetical protein
MEGKAVKGRREDWKKGKLEECYNVLPSFHLSILPVLFL